MATSESDSSIGRPLWFQICVAVEEKARLPKSIGDRHYTVVSLSVCLRHCALWLNDWSTSCSKSV